MHTTKCTYGSMHMLSASLMVTLDQVCIKQPHGVVPSPLAAVEETQSVLGIFGSRSQPRSDPLQGALQLWWQL